MTSNSSFPRNSCRMQLRTPSPTCPGVVAKDGAIRLRKNLKLLPGFQSISSRNSRVLNGIFVCDIESIPILGAFLECSSRITVQCFLRYV